MKKKDTRLIFPVSPPNPLKYVSYLFYWLGIDEVITQVTTLGSLLSKSLQTILVNMYAQEIFILAVGLNR